MTGARPGFVPSGVYEPTLFSIGSHSLRTHSRAGASIQASAAWPLANLGVYVPFTISIPITVYEWWWGNGTLTTAHNIDFGIYREDFTKVQSLGPTAGATTASVIVNTTTWTNLDLAPGAYYMAMSDDSVRNFFGSSDAAGLYQASGCMEQTGVATLPSPAVPVAYTRAFLPNFGMNCYTVAY
jgi:hypothetical protein